MTGDKLANGREYIHGADMHIDRLIIEDIGGKTIYQSNEKRRGLFQIDISGFAKAPYLLE